MSRSSSQSGLFTQSVALLSRGRVCSYIHAFLFSEISKSVESPSHSRLYSAREETGFLIVPSINGTVPSSWYSLCMASLKTSKHESLFKELIVGLVSSQYNSILTIAPYRELCEKFSHINSVLLCFFTAIIFAPHSAKRKIMTTANLNSDIYKTWRYGIVRTELYWFGMSHISRRKKQN